MKRNLYLKTKPVEDALAEYMEALSGWIPTKLWDGRLQGRSLPNAVHRSLMLRPWMELLSGLLRRKVLQKAVL